MQQQGQQSGQAQTGTRDETYDVIAVLYHALQGVENCQTYLQDASGDEQLRGFFEQALSAQRQLADQAKQLLAQRLQNESGGSAFSFGEGSSDSGIGGGADSAMSGGAAGGVSGGTQGEPSLSGQSGDQKSGSGFSGGGGSSF